MSTLGKLRSRRANGVACTRAPPPGSVAITAWGTPPRIVSGGAVSGGAVVGGVPGVVRGDATTPPLVGGLLAPIGSAVQAVSATISIASAHGPPFIAAILARRLVTMEVEAASTAFIDQKPQ